MLRLQPRMFMSLQSPIVDSLSPTPTQQRPIEPSGTSSTADKETAEVFCLRVHEIDAAWPQIEKLLSRIEDPTLSPAEVRAQAKDKKALVWGLQRGAEIVAAWVTKIESNSTSKWGVVWLCAGDGLKEITDAYEMHTEPYFRLNGCLYAQINGRRGWLKVLNGYQEIGAMLAKNLWANR